MIQFNKESITIRFYFMEWKSRKVENVFLFKIGLELNWVFYSFNNRYYIFEHLAYKNGKELLIKTYFLNYYLVVITLSIWLAK